MGDPVLNENEFAAIGDYVKAHIHEWIREKEPDPETRLPYQIEERVYDLSERIVRVEEGIKHMQETLQQTLEYMDKRFEQVDKRFEQVDKRFEQVDKRFEELRTDMNHRFNQMFAFSLAIGGMIMGLMSIFEFVT